MWSFGVVVWEVFTAGALPFSQWTNAEVITEVPHSHGDPRADVQVAKGVRLPCPPNTPGGLAGLMASCWLVDPGARPTPSIVCHIAAELFLLLKLESAWRTR
jgi:hypothetical protein